MVGVVGVVLDVWVGVAIWVIRAKINERNVYVPKCRSVWGHQVPAPLVC